MIIGFTGRIAAGKETLKDFFIKKGFDYFTLSQMLIEEMEKKGIPITRNNLQNYGDMLRKKQGAGVLMEIFLKKINPNGNHIIDGIRNPGEVIELKKHNSILIAIDAPQKSRFERLLKRAKPSDPKTWEEFLKVDDRDFSDKDNPLGQQVGKCMEMADFTIINDGNVEDLKKKIEEVWNRIQSRNNIKERVSIFIDGSNFYHSLKNLNISKIDFQKLIDILLNNRDLVSIKYYNASLDISVDKNRYWKQQKFFNYLRKIPFFEVILCKMRKIRKSNRTIDFEVKGDDVHLTVDLISGAYENIYDTAILVSGDEDFVPAIKKVQQLSKKVENAYFISSSSNALKNISNKSVCISNFIKELI